MSTALLETAAPPEPLDIFETAETPAPPWRLDNYDFTSLGVDLRVLDSPALRQQAGAEANARLAAAVAAARAAARQSDAFADLERRQSAVATLAAELAVAEKQATALTTQVEAAVLTGSGNTDRLEADLAKAQQRVADLQRRQPILRGVAERVEAEYGSVLLRELAAAKSRFLQEAREAKADAEAALVEALQKPLAELLTARRVLDAVTGIGWRVAAGD